MLELLPYLANPLWHLKFRGRPKGGIFLGVELEYEIVDNAVMFQGLAARKIGECMGEDFVIVKHDGTLTYGVEIVSAPASLMVHKKRWRKFFDQKKELSLESRPSCGMHVHVSRAPLTPAAVSQIAMFVGEPANRAFIVGVAGRESAIQALLKKKQKDCGVIPQECNHRVVRIDPYHNDRGLARKYGNIRYEGVNLVNPTTIEFRIFACPESHGRFVVNLEFVDALVRYVSEVAGKLAVKEVLRPLRFMQWIVGKKEYRHLEAFLGRHCKLVLETQENSPG